MAANSTFLYIFILLFISKSLSRSTSPQNIQTFYPFSPPANNVPTPLPQLPSTIPTPHSLRKTSTVEVVGRAVGVTAATTAVASALLFFLLLRYSRWKREESGRTNYANVVAPQSNSFTRYGANLQRLIVDENGLDAQYYKSMREEKRSVSPLREEKDDQLVSSIQLVHNVAPSLPPPPGAGPRPQLQPKELSVETVPSPPPPPPPPISSYKSPAAPPTPPPPTKPAEEKSSNEKVKLKPLHWDKVNPNVKHSMVWDKIENGSFKFDGDLMEALFGSVATSRNSPNGDSGSTSSSQIFILDARKSQNKAIVLKSLAISTREIIDALNQGHGLNADTVEKLVRIALTDEEATQIIAFDGDPTRLADAESFLHHLLKSVPTAFTRLNAMLFRSTYDSEVSSIKESLKSLESACKELRNRGIFFKLLEAVLKAGNRLNAGTERGNAQAFNLTALRKLSDVKSSDGKTTLLQFIVQEVVRAEGKRCLLLLNRNRSNGGSQTASDDPAPKDERGREYMMLGLPVIGGLSAEFSNVKKAATLDYDVLSQSISSLAAQMTELRSILRQCGGHGGFEMEINRFLDTAEVEMREVIEEQTRVVEVVRKTTDYYQAANFKDKGANPFQLFVIVRDFLGMVDQVCVEIARNVQRRRSARSVAGSSLPESPRVLRFPKLPVNFMLDNSKSSFSDSFQV